MQEIKTISKNKPEEEQKLVLINRDKLQLSGVENVESFSDKEIVLITNMGKLTIKGEDLNINQLNVETKDFSMEGYVVSLIYSKYVKKDKSFIERIFK